MHRKRWALMVLAAGLVFTGGARADATNRVPILRRDGTWRVFYTWALPEVKTAAGLQPRILKPAREVVISDMAGFNFLTTYPPAGWTAPEFDDTAWARRRYPQPYANGETDSRAGGGGPCYYQRQIVLRGKFAVSAPDQVKDLRLNLAFRGGAIVYLNGTEIRRAFLPEGRLDPGALAEAYPDDITVNADGKPVPWYPDNTRLKEVTPLRVRHIHNLAIPAGVLRPGRNVLAVEIHSAPYHQSSLDYRLGIRWVPCGLVELALDAATGEGLAPNLARPTGLQVWSANAIEPVGEADWGDPLEPLAPVRLAGCRNGCFSGRVIASSDRPIAGLSAKVSDLEGSGHTIPASALRVSYGAQDSAGTIAPRFDGLLDAPPTLLPAGPRGAVQPIGLTVRVPKDAAPGAYRGALTIATGSTIVATAPIELTVSDWTVPDPVAFTYWCGMVQSTEGPAGAYETPLWSERHLQLVGRSFDLIAQLGSKVLFLPLAAQMELGNAEGMVRFRVTADGTYAADLSAVEKYLDVALQHLGKPRYVICGVWQVREQTNPDEQGAPMISVVGADNKVTVVRGPRHGSAESIAFWKPVLTQIDAMLEKRGLAGTLVLGFGDDILPNVTTAAAYHQILPNAGWYDGAHVSTFSIVRIAADQTVPIVYQCNVYGCGEVPDPAVARRYGWNRQYVIPGGMQVWLDREVYDNAAIARYRGLPESMTMSDRPGQGCFGADFWPPTVPAGQRRMETIFSRYPRSQNVGAGGKGITARSLLYPGPDGAVPTLRFEAYREGLQEAEARIAIEKRLLEKPCRVPAPLAAQAQALLDERARRARLGFAVEFLPWSGWEDHARQLFEMAGQVTK